LLVLIAIVIGYTAWAGVFALNLWRVADHWMSSRWFNPWGFPVAPARGFTLVGFAVGLVVLAWIGIQSRG
jgi:hypothetical protein